MRQPHKNLFFSYRGGRRDDASDLLLDKQLEDNVTKALVHVLEHTSRNHVLAPFLRRIAGLRKLPELDEVEFALQRVDIARPLVSSRIALGIAPDEKIDKRRKAAHQAGRPDAWIWADDHFAILVETKVRGPVSNDQLRRHKQGAEGWTSKNARDVSRSWADIYDFFQDVRRHSARADAITRLLLDEFVRYLRMIALASDTTFDLDDFGYFLLRPAERDTATRELLGRKLRRFTEELAQSTALKRIVRQYGPAGRGVKDFVNPGVFRKNSENYWITVGPKERRNRCHFTVRLGEDGISLEAFSPHKSFTQKLVAKIARDPKAFIASLRGIKRREPFLIRLREAYFHNPEGFYKGQRIGARVDYLQVHPSVLNEQNLSHFIIEPIKQRLSYRHLRPEIFLVRHFRLSEVVGKSTVVATVANAAESMLGYFAFALDV